MIVRSRRDFISLLLFCVNLIFERNYIMTIDIEEWKKGIPQRELEQKIREYEEEL